MKKTFFIICGLLSIIIISVSFTKDDPTKYKNLKILPKDISKEAMDSSMEHYTVSLGVTCGFCHVHNKEKDTWDMASDAIHHKLIARKMILMTNGINTKYFPTEKSAKEKLIQTITCYTCHKGDVIPLELPMEKEAKK